MPRWSSTKNLLGKITYEEKQMRAGRSRRYSDFAVSLTTVEEKEA
jgi:hypothetical protein